MIRTGLILFVLVALASIGYIFYTRVDGHNAAFAALLGIEYLVALGALVTRRS